MGLSSTYFPKFESVPSLDGTREVQLPIGGPIFSLVDGTFLQGMGVFGELESNAPWSLPLIGGETAFVEASFWAANFTPREETTHIDGCIVFGGDGEHRHYHRLVAYQRSGKTSNPYPLGSLPENTKLCMTPRHVHEFVSSLDDSSESPDRHRLGQTSSSLGDRERNGLLLTIAALLSFVLTPRSGRTSQAAVITELIENYGEKDGISKTTLESRFAAGNRLLTGG
jgi:hypothetical protein